MWGFEKQILNKIKPFCDESSHVQLIAAEERAIYGAVFDFQNKHQLSQMIQSGISIGFFEQLLKCLPFKEEDWSKYLDLSSKSFQRYSKVRDFMFKPIHSEKILELTEVMTFGLEVFGNKNDFQDWLQTPSIIFHNQKPFDFLFDSYGKEMVMAELNRIEYGIFV